MGVLKITPPRKESSIGRVSQSMERDTRKQDLQPRGTLMHELTD